MISPRRVARSIVVSTAVVALSAVLLACGDNGGSGSIDTGDPVADAFAEQLVVHGEFGYMSGDRIGCFAAHVITGMSQGRLDALGFTAADMADLWSETKPLWTQVEWNDAEVDLLVDSIEVCVGDDPSSINAVLLGEVAHHQPDFAACFTEEATSIAGEGFYLDAFRSRIVTPWAENDEALMTVVEAAVAACNDESSGEYATPAAIGEDDRLGPVVGEEWSIALDDEGVGIHTIALIRTFPVAWTAVEARGGRLVWDETEIDLCAIAIRGADEDVVQIGDVFPTDETCEGAETQMQQAFDDFGLPKTACVFVQSQGVEDEYCAPLAVD